MRLRCPPLTQLPCAVRAQKAQAEAQKALAETARIAAERADEAAAAARERAAAEAKDREDVMEHASRELAAAAAKSEALQARTAPGQRGPTLTRCFATRHRALLTCFGRTGAHQGAEG